LKRPSDTSSPTPPEITFFTDRDLGKKFPAILRDGGLSVVRYGDHFGERNATDDEWIAFAATRQWVALSHDRNIRSDPIAIKAVMENNARLFIVRGKHLTGAEKASLVLGALGQIYRHLREQPAAFIAVVRRLTLAGGVLKPDVKVRLTLEEWKQGRRPPPEADELPL
jgi:PIN domain-containing protein